MKSDNLAVPTLAVLEVGESFDNQIFFERKRDLFQKYGLNCVQWTCPESSDKSIIMDLIHKMNESNEIHGIMLNLPLPKNHSLNENCYIEQISPYKDVDKITQINYYKMIVTLHIDHFP
jgi:methylenetetrahydrofolate dehydrogenase (NADP+)/methenyltetrahydrofolate cyclohydrolase